MAEFPALPVWTDSYLADTGHLTTLEHGAYLLLLFTMWRNGGTLPNDDKKLARFSRLTTGQWSRIKPTMMEFFTISSDSISQSRLTDELVAVRQRSRTQSDNARAKSRKDKELKRAMAQPKDDLAQPNSSQTSASISITNIKELPPSGEVRKPDRKPQKRATKIPDDFQPDLQPAIDEGLQPQEAIMSLARFKDHAQANGRTQIDWLASWRLWYRNDIAQKSRGRSSRMQATQQPTLHPVIAEAERRKAERNAEHNSEQSRTIDHDRRPAEGRGFGNQDFLVSALGQGRKPD